MKTKDEALKMAIEALDNVCIKIEKWTKGGKWTAGKEALAKCKEALEHEQSFAEKTAQMSFMGLWDAYTTLKMKLEALEQPAQAITEGSQLSNIKAGSQSEKPSPPPAPKHTCTYSRTMNQEYPRKCIHCGEVEALAQQAQEPVLYIDQGGLDGHATWAQPNACQDTDIALYTHPAPSWQGLNEGEINDIKTKAIMGANGMSVEQLLGLIVSLTEQASKEKNDKG